MQKKKRKEKWPKKWRFVVMALCRGGVVSQNSECFFVCKYGVVSWRCSFVVMAL